MNISNSQVDRLRHFVRAGLRALFRPEPQTAVEWADANYYLPKESAYQEGRWETLPFQRAIMNAMGSDYIREVNVVKSARVGYSGMTGYNGIIARLQQAASDPMVDGILLDMDTPGGMVAGAFDCADIIARVRDIKPVWALANDMNCSAGQLLASAASRRLVTQTARTGSIGVMMAHSNYGAALEKQGVEITLIYSGSHKVDGNPYSHLPDDVRETLQSRMDATRRMFAQKVSAYTGLSVQAVLDIRLSAADVNAYSLGWSGKYGADAGGVPWNEKTGLYTVSGSGSSYI
ncbi:S49 family peptidase, partial [Escherichia coli]|uniref:S49 family peptidase n=1 Tax=Escherichia coli TaxID=562 RepID=UPI001FCE14A5